MQKHIHANAGIMTLQINTLYLLRSNNGPRHSSIEQNVTCHVHTYQGMLAVFTNAHTHTHAHAGADVMS